MMKFVALALTILLAAGCQARNLQADAPSQGEQVKAVILMYLKQVKDIAQGSLKELKSAEHEKQRTLATDALDTVYNYLTRAVETIIPASEPIYEQFMVMTSQQRAEMKELREALTPKVLELRDTLMKHMAEYSEKLKPFLREYISAKRDEMIAMKQKLDPLISDLTPIVKHNLEETKTKLMPIVQAVHAKVAGGIEESKSTVFAYLEETREQMEKTVTSLREKLQSEAFRTKMFEHQEKVKVAIQNMIKEFDDKVQ